MTLTWAPPAQSNTVTVTVGPGYYTGTFAPDQDVTFLWPTSRYSSFEVTGGRHLRVIGGEVLKTTAGSGLRFTGCTGSVFLEGLHVDMSKVSADAINVSGTTGRPDVYLQNLRVTGVNGSMATTHADVFQPQGPIGSLYVDRLTATSNYQGLFLPPQQPITSIDLRRVNLSYTDPTATHVTYLLWLLDQGQTPPPATLTDVWVQPRAGQSLAKSVWPAPVSPDGGRSGYWPHPVSGFVRAGSPADFATAGLNYTSPGYT